MYVEHTLSGTRLGTTGSITFAFDWTPPSSDAGPVNVYVAANAANGNNVDDSGDHIYTASLTLTPAPASSNTPTITASGIVNGASFASGIASGSWVTIYGTNLSSASTCDPSNPQPGCRTWAAGDFVNGTPTSLDGVSVSMGGKNAYVYFVSPTQINVQAPDLDPGAVPVSVKTDSGSSNEVSVPISSFAPGFFTAGKYALATHVDGSVVAPSGTFPGSSPATPGETITLWGTGFGPVNPRIPSGITSAALNGNTVSFAITAPAISVGGAPALVVGSALNPDALGLYQIAITVPSSLASGDQTIVAAAGGSSSPPSGVFLAVQ
jgi:uncharacterized protein (TIGR03437 family)